ncbi:hypothetical protein LXA43DRAFT_1168927 [Ganoderma leucocontextum]|nr:hypothetical protein LXA43DRAFT_1168927 [Ganoderma leucocontextum]
MIHWFVGNPEDGPVTLLCDGTRRKRIRLPTCRYLYFGSCGSKSVLVFVLLSDRGLALWHWQTAMSKPYYGPLEDKHDINLERFLLAGDFVSGVGYGVQLVLWLSCAVYLWQQRRKGRHTTFLLCYITILLVAETIYSVAQARTVQLMYVENRRYPGGPWQYFLNTQNEPINIICYVSLCVVISMCDLLVLWRCWVIWTALDHHLAYLVTFVPVIMLLSSFVMGTFWTIESTRRGQSLYDSVPRAFGVAYFSLSLGVNVVLTALIVARLLAFRRANAAFLPPDHAERYLSLAALIVESAALYTLFAVAFLISYGLNAPVNQVLLGFAQAAQQVATYLIIYRVADGTAWSKDTMSKQTMSSADFCGGARDMQVCVPSRLDLAMGSSMIEVDLVSSIDAECGALQER